MTILESSRIRFKTRPNYDVIRLREIIQR